MSTVESTAVSRLFDIHELATEIVKNVGPWKNLSLVSKRLNNACSDAIKNREYTLRDFSLDVKEAKRYGLSGGTLRERREEIRSRRYPFVTAIDLKPEDPASTEQTANPSTMIDTMFGAFENREELLATFPNLERVSNILVDVVDGSWNKTPMTRKATLRVAGTGGRLTLIPDGTLEMGTLVEPSIPQGFPLLASARTRYDYFRRLDVGYHRSEPPYIGSMDISEPRRSHNPQPPIREYATNLQSVHTSRHRAPIRCMKFQLDRASNEVSHYTGLASTLFEYGTIGPSGATRVGYSRSPLNGPPPDLACISEIFTLAPSGVTHVSFDVEKSCEEDIGRLNDTQLELPESLKCITFEHPHRRFPNKEYQSAIENWIERSRPGEVEVRFACNEPISCKEGHNAHGGSTWRWDEKDLM